MSLPFGYQKALDDFRRAHSMALLQQILGKLTRRPVELLSFDEVSRQLHMIGGSDLGLQDIPIDAIVGSVGRYTDFTRTFLPRQDRDMVRWARVKSLMTDDQLGLPPIEVYKINQSYFVKDGHHRVSVARQMKARYIQAQVNEVRTKASLPPDASPDELILQAEYADFLAKTQIDRLIPEANLVLTVPGYYSKFEEHIRVHRYFMGLEMQRDIPEAEGIKHWYEAIYLPVKRAIEDRGILREFPGRTEADLYIWISEHRYLLEKELGWSIRPEVAATHLANKSSPRFSRVFQRNIRRFINRITSKKIEPSPAPGTWRLQKGEREDCLFRDMLVPLSAEPTGWAALEQAAHFAYCTGTNLQGLHVAAESKALDNPATWELKARFDERVKAAGLQGSLAVVTGEVSDKICEWSTLTDLVVLNLAHPPASQIISRLSSGFHTIIRKCPRPILAVPESAGPVRNILLAFDDSLKSREGLYISTYLAGRLPAPLVVLIVSENRRSARRQLRTAQKYLEEHQVDAQFLIKEGPVGPHIQKTAAEFHSSLIVLGGYGSTPVVEAVVGSTVDEVLRNTSIPVLICQ